MEIVTGKAGVPHVSSADDGRRIAGEVGTGSYVLQTGGKLAPSLVDANTVRIATGDMIVQGRHIGVTAPEDVKVASGSQGKKRMDYICVHYTRDVSGSSPTLVETVEWKVLRGTPGSSAVAPSVPKGSILDGNADVTVPICSVTFDGLTTGQPKLLIPELTPLADLVDSVSPGRDPSLDRSGIAEGWNVFTRSVSNATTYTAVDSAYPEPYARVRRVHPSVPSGDHCSSVGQAHGLHHIRRDNDGIYPYQRHRVRQRKRLWGAGDYRPVRSG